MEVNALTSHVYDHMHMHKKSGCAVCAFARRTLRSHFFFRHVRRECDFGRPGGYVATVVRGSGDDAARSRLRSGYDTGDAELLATFDRLAEGRLKVFAGLLPPT